MYESKLIEQICKLNKTEKHYFLKWTKSPVANARQDVIQLTEFILSKRSITAQTMDKDQAFKYVYPKKRFSVQQLRYVMNYTLTCLDAFLAYYYWKNHTHLEPLHLIAQQQKLNVSTISNTIKKTQQTYNQQTIQDSQQSLLHYFLANENYAYLSKNSRHEAFDFERISNSLHHFVIAEVLRNACLAFSVEQVGGNKALFPLLEVCISLYKSKMYADVPSIEIYGLLYSALTKNDDDDFKKLFTIIFEDQHLFSDKEWKDIILLCINYCIKNLNVSKKGFALYAYQLYQLGLNKKYLLENNELSRFTFKNIVFIGTKHLKNYKEVIEFIKKYQHYLHPKYQKQTVIFNTAIVYFAQKKYNETLQLLQQTEFDDVLWNLNAKNMLMMIFYEQNEDEVLLSFLKSYKIYLYRQKSIGYHLQRYKKVVDFCFKMNKIKNEQKKRAELLIEISNDNQLPERDWFIEQLKPK